MTARILDGDSLAKRLTVQLAPRIAAVSGERGSPPLLAILSIGGNTSSELYLKKKLEACREAGIETSVQAVPESITETEVLKLLAELDKNEGVDGVIVETPLPKHLRLAPILDRLPPAKDAEGLTPANFGKLFAAKNLAELEKGGTLIPPTPHALLQLLAEALGPSKRSTSQGTAIAPSAVAQAAGKVAVVVGRSNIVGKPMAYLLSCLDATVTLCHSKTKDLRGHLKRADIVVSAVGRPRFIHGKSLKPGAVVLDAGINYEGKKLYGDVDAESAKTVAGVLSPVPGGVGPVTVAMLLANVVAAAERRLLLGKI